MNDEFLTVSELNNFIHDVLSSGFPKSLWICGEIQGYDRGKDKKHVFFELCEKDSHSNEIIARTSLVMFANVRPKIDLILKKSENAFVLKDDIEVKFLCKVDFYPGHGQIRLIVEAIDPIYTLGKIAQDRQRLITMLKQKGILDQNKRQMIPRVPLNVGLITSYDSAAYHDFIDELKRSGFAFRIFLVNAIMQGKNTESSVAKAIKTLTGIDHLDLIVITRGGGSIADLSCFDSAVIAQAIAESSLPVMSGIGHEINTSITDLAAHTFAKTPTAVARILIGRVEEFLVHLNEKQEELINCVDLYIKNERTRLSELGNNMQKSTMAMFKAHQSQVVRIAEALNRAPLGALKSSRQNLLQSRDNLKKTIYLRLQNSRTKINNCEKLILMASPQRVLKRGFSITRAADGSVVRSVKAAVSAKVLTTVLMDGQVISEVKGGYEQ